MINKSTNLGLLWFSWVLITTVSYCTGMAMGVSLMGKYKYIGIVFFFMGLMVSGLFASIGQKLILLEAERPFEGKLLDIIRIPFSLAICVFILNGILIFLSPSNTLGMSLVDAIELLVLSCVVGVIAGAPQWFVVFNKRKGTFLEVVSASSLTHFVGLNAIYFVFNFILDVNDSRDFWFISGLIMGTIMGISVGIMSGTSFLSVLAQRESHNP